MLISFFSDEGAYVVCDNEKVQLDFKPQQICSNTSHLFLLNENGDVIQFSKASRFIKLTGVHGCRSIAANDDDLYCISSMLVV